MNDSYPLHSHSIEMPMTNFSGRSCHGGTENNIAKFYLDVEEVKGDLKELDRLCHNLRNSQEQSKALYNAEAVKELKKKMKTDLSLALSTAKHVKGTLEAIDRILPENGPSSDLQRTSVVNGLKKNLKDEMDNFNRVRETISMEYQETIQRRYFTVTGENPDEDTVDRLISTGESETFLKKAIQEQGRDQILDTINEIQERHEAVKDIEKGLNELHQIFLDMAVLVEHQGAQLDDLEGNVTRANSLVRSGADRLVKSRFCEKNTLEYSLIVIVGVVIIVLFIVRPWGKGGGGRRSSYTRDNF